METLEICKLYKKGESLKSISIKAGKAVGTIRRILIKEGVPIKTKGGIDKLPEDLIVRDYKEGLSSKKIGERYKVCRQTIDNLLEKNGIDRNNIYHNKDLVENYWGNIDTIDKAYFLGFLLTDGNIYGNDVRLQIHKKDIHILESFKKVTNNVNPIRIDSRNCATLSVKRKKWVSDLANLNIVPNKTLITCPPNISSELISHFIRGLIDGDGWISNKGHQIGFCGNFQTVEWISNTLSEVLNIRKPKIHSKENLNQVVWCSKLDISSIIKFIYKDSSEFRLERKYNEAQLFHDSTEVK